MSFNKQFGGPSFGMYPRGGNKRLSPSSTPIDFSVSDIVFEKKRPAEKAEVDWKTNDICFHSTKNCCPAAPTQPKATSQSGYSHGYISSYTSPPPHMRNDTVYNPALLSTTEDMYSSQAYMDPTVYGSPMYSNGLTTYPTSAVAYDQYYSSSPVPVPVQASQQYASSPYGVNYMYGSPSLYNEIQYSDNPTLAGMYDSYHSPDVSVNTADTVVQDVAKQLEHLLASPTNLNAVNSSSPLVADSGTVSALDQSETEKRSSASSGSSSLDSSREEYSELESDEELNLLVENIIADLE